MKTTRICQITNKQTLIENVEVMSKAVIQCNIVGSTDVIRLRLCPTKWHILINKLDATEKYLIRDNPAYGGLTFFGIKMTVNHAKRIFERLKTNYCDYESNIHSRILNKLIDTGRLTQKKKTENFPCCMLI